MKLSILSLLDAIAKQTRIVMVNGKLYVEKTYSVELGVIKWYLVATSNLAIGIYPFKFRPAERLEREVQFLTSKNSCFEKPGLVLVDYVNLKIVRDYLKGDPYGFNAPLSIHYALGKELGRCHDRGWALGDTKVSNFIYQDNRVYIVDAEQAVQESRPDYFAWDLLVLISTLAVDGYTRALHLEDRERVFENILRGYTHGNSRGIEVVDVLKNQMKPLVYFLIPFPLSHMFYKKLEEQS